MIEDYQGVVYYEFMKRTLLILMLSFSTFTLFADNPKVCIVLDDFGYSNLEDYKTLNSIPFNLTFAVIPGLEGSRTIFNLELKPDKEIIIHFPWEPVKKGLLTGYPVYIDSNMDSTKIQLMIKRAVDELPEAVGVNNHMGSRISKDERVLNVFMEELKSRELFFFDSNVIPGSRAFDIAEKKGIETSRNNFFMDYINSPENIAEIFEKAIEYAEKEGHVYIIGHCTRSGTLNSLGDLMNKYSDRVDFCHISDIIPEGE